MPRFVPLAVAAVCGALALAASVSAEPPRPPSRPHTFDQSRWLDINAIGMSVTNYGHWGYDLATGGSGLYYPIGSANTALFAGGLWLGSDPRAVVAEYSSEYAPGAILPGGAPDDPARPEYVVYKVRSFQSPDDTTHREGTPPVPNGYDLLISHSWSEYMAGAVPYGAPWKIHRLPDTSTPDPSDSVDVAGPDTYGAHQMLWCVYNDADPSRHTNNAGQTAPLGLEVRQSVFAWNRPGALGTTVFLRFEVINKGGLNHDSLYAALWSDPDLGGFTDDLAGYDVARALGYVYNATSSDAQYGSAPPALGMDLLRGPASGGGNTVPSSFFKYINGTDPSSATHTLRYMRGLYADGSPVVDPTTSQITTFMHTGDPVAGTGWLDSNPADRRMMVTAGPLAMAPGDTAVMWTAIVIGHGVNRLSSISALRFYDDQVQQFFDSGFSELDPGPGDPCFTTDYDCPRTVAFWRDEAAPGPGALTDAQVQAIAAAVDAATSAFDWPDGGERDAFWTLMQSGGGDARTLALQQYAALLATDAAQSQGIREGDGDCITVDLAPPVFCPDSVYVSVSAALAPVDSVKEALATFADEPPGTGVPIDAISGFGNLGHVFGWDAFGSTLNPYADPDSVPDVVLRFDGTQLAHRYVRVTNPFTQYLYGGFFEVPVTAWDTTSGEQLELGFLERYDGDTTAIATCDRTWSPDTSSNGGREYLFVFRRPYTGAARAELRVDDGILNGVLPVAHVLLSRRVADGVLFDPLDVLTLGSQMTFEGGFDRELYLLARDGAPPEHARYAEIAACLGEINLGLNGSTCDVATAATVSVMEAEALPGLVRVSWRLSEPAIAAMERSEGGEWAPVTTARTDGEGVIAFEDRGVKAGGRYGYRLRLADDPGTTHGEVWVTVPHAHRLSLAGFRPNPAGETPSVAFTLPARGAVRLEVLDVTGRRAVDRALGSLAPGPHHVRLEGAGRLPAGVYFLRLTHAGKSVITRGVLMR